jgi:geranylgeranyl pyrophosphate synthase
MAQILTKITQGKKHLSSSFGPLEKALLETDNIVLPLLKKLIQEYTNASIWDKLEYSLINKAHFDRAYFVKLGCEAIGGDYKKILPAMASVEFKYASEVVIDDVFDNNDERMGKPSMPKKYTQNASLSLSAILKSLSSISLLSNFHEVNVNYDSFIDIAIKDEHSHYQVYLGQLADLQSETMGVNEITDSFYLDMIKNTTGVDVGYCFELGCLLGSGTKEQQDAFYEFGVCLGTAMQVRDDMIDYVNDKSLINKEPFRDFETHKKRLPIIVAYRFGQEDEKKIIRELFDKNHLTDVDKTMLASFVKTDFVLGYIGKVINELLAKAMLNIEKANIEEKSLSIIKQIGGVLNV